MTNKYKKAMENINISDNIEKKILVNCERKRFNLIYLSVLLLIICVSITVVQAEEIKETISNLKIVRCLGKQQIKSEQSSIVLDEINTLKTNVDDLYIHDIEKPKEQNNSYFKEYKAKSIKEIENIIGVNILDFKNDNFLYTYDANLEGKITTIGIDTLYKISCKNKCDIIKNNKDKLIKVHATIYTENFNGNIENDSYSDTETSKVFSSFANIKTNGIVLSGNIDNHENNTSYLDIHFNYDNIKYVISAYNMSFEDVENYISNNLILK